MRSSLSLFVVGVAAGSLQAMVGLLLALSLAVACGAPLWILGTRRSSFLELGVLGGLLGLGVLGAGAVLAGLTGWDPVRWLPPALAVICWWPARRRRRRVPTVSAIWPRLGALAGQVLLAPSLLAHLRTTVPSTEWTSFYVDIPWHTAFTAEALTRAPEVYPWVSDLTLGYTWFFFGSLGSVGAISGLDAGTLLIRVGPALMSGFLPVVVALLARAVTGSRLAALAAPVVVALAHSPLLAFRDTLEITPQWLLANRDYSDIMIMITLRTSRASRVSTIAAGGVLFLAAFAAAASKGSALPVLVGAFGLLALLSVLRRADLGRRIAEGAVVAAAILAAQFLVTRSTAYLRVDPLSFLGDQGPPGLEPWLTLGVVGLLVLPVLFVALTPLLIPERRSPGRYLLTGGAAGGIAALLVTGHPGLSQLYFLHAAWPLLVVAVVAAVAAWTRSFLFFAPAVATAALVLTVALVPPGVEGNRAWVIRTSLIVVLLLLVVCAVTVIVPAVRRRERTVHVLALTSVALAGAVFSVQNWGLPMVALPASVPSTREDGSALSRDQLDALSWLRENSSPGELVMTNKHCRAGSLETDDCDPRWFAVSAFAERRVVVEGYSYTRLSKGVPLEDRYWDAELLAANDRFLSAPDPETCRFFAEQREVGWIYIDTREPHSAALDDFATERRRGDDAIVYSLDRC